MVPRISVELLEDELSAIVQAGDYTSKEAVIIHALEILLAAHPPLRINTAVELYRRGKVTLSRAAEIAGLEFEAFKEQLARHNVSVQIDTSLTEVRTGADVIRCLRETSRYPAGSLGGERGVAPRSVHHHCGFTG